MNLGKTYLGDGVYIEPARVYAQNDALVLTTEDGAQTTNRIVLEPEVLLALFEYLGHR